MGYQPRIKSPRGAMHEYRKSLREKGRDKKRLHRRGRPEEERQVPTEKEISELTLKRLHTLGSQKFGSSPFSEHFDRWLTNIEAVLIEFKSNPNIGIDDQFVTECSQILSSIKLQLEEKRRREASVDQEIKSLAYCNSCLEEINTKYATAANTVKSRKNSEVKRLYNEIDRLKKEQERVIRMKTGFFRGISKKDREQKEMAVMQELSDRQKELELVMLDFNAQQKALREEFERKREPLQKQQRFFQKKIGEMETDGSLEERWFACEALADAVNTFLQRKAAEPR